MSDAQAMAGALEADLLHAVMKGTDGARWHLAELETLAVYPYAPADGAHEPAFARGDDGEEWDCLDFTPRCGAEERLISGLDEREARERLLTHRIAQSECDYPHVARYLLSHYERLSSRRPKGRPLADYGRRWYEYLWPRDASRMLARPKLVSPRLTRWPRFALDDEGILPSDSCVAIATPTSTQAKHRLADFHDGLSRLVGRELGHRDVLLYALAFVNSTAAAFLLRIGREPTPYGSWNVNEEYLRLIRLPTPDATIVEPILELSQKCVDRARRGASFSEPEAVLDGLVFEAYGLAGSTAASEIASWGEEAREAG